MNFRGIRAMSLVATCALAPLASLPAKAVSSDTQVQMLANFPALQRLAAKGNARTLRRYLARVAAAYRAAGYNAVADALPKANDVITLFGEVKGTAGGSDIRKARQALRHLASALASNAKIAVPSHAGETIPNYRLIAEVFVENSSRALKNISAGKSVANTLRHKAGTLVVKNETGSTFTTSGTGSYSVSAGSITVNNVGGAINLSSAHLVLDGAINGSGTLALNGISIYSGDWTLNAGNLTALTGSALGTGTVSVNGGTLVLNFSDMLAVFPVGIEIPTGFGDHPYILLNVAAEIGTVEYPAGTRIVKPVAPSVLPDGAIWLSTPATITTTGTPAPSPTPAE
jgi:hypothetical protein